MGTEQEQDSQDEATPLAPALTDVEGDERTPMAPAFVSVENNAPPSKVFAEMAWYTLKETPPTSKDSTARKVASWLIYLGFAAASCTLFIPPTLAVANQWGSWTQPFLLYGAIIPNLVIEFFALDYLSAEYQERRKKNAHSDINAYFNVDNPTWYDHVKKAAYIATVAGLAILSSFVFAAVAWYTTAFPGGSDNPSLGGNMPFAWANLIFTLLAFTVQFLYSLHNLFSGTNPKIRRIEKAFLRFFIADSFKLHQQEAADAIRADVCSMLEQARNALVQILEENNNRKDPENTERYAQALALLDKLSAVDSENKDELLAICASISKLYQEPTQKPFYDKDIVWAGLGHTMAFMSAIVGVVPFAIDMAFTVIAWGVNPFLAAIIAAGSSLPMCIFFYKLTCDMFKEAAHLAKRLSPRLYNAAKWTAAVACTLSVATGAQLILSNKILYSTTFLGPWVYPAMLAIMIIGTAIANGAACISYIKNRMTNGKADELGSPVKQDKAMFADAYNKLDALKSNINNMPVEKIIQTAVDMKDDAAAEDTLANHTLNKEMVKDKIHFIQGSGKHIDTRSTVKRFFSPAKGAKGGYGRMPSDRCPSPAA